MQWKTLEIHRRQEPSGPRKPVEGSSGSVKADWKPCLEECLDEENKDCGRCPVARGKHQRFGRFLDKVRARGVLTRVVESEEGNTRVTLGTIPAERGEGDSVVYLLNSGGGGTAIGTGKIKVTIEEGWVNRKARVLGLND